MKFFLVVRKKALRNYPLYPVSCLGKAVNPSVLLSQTGAPRCLYFRHQNRKTHQQEMYMLTRTFYERPTGGKKFF
jgi:hypothetical protein